MHIDIWGNCKRDVSFDIYLQTLIEIVYANQDVILPSIAWIIYYLSIKGF